MVGREMKIGPSVRTLPPAANFAASSARAQRILFFFNPGHQKNSRFVQGKEKSSSRSLDTLRKPTKNCPGVASENGKTIQRILGCQGSRMYYLACRLLRSVSLRADSV